MTGGGSDLIKLWCSGYQNCTTFIRVKTWVLRRITSCSMYQRFTKLRTSVYNPNCRSSHERCSIIKGVLRIFAKLIGKHLCQSLFFRPATLLKKRIWHRCFLVNCAKFLRTPFLQSTSGRLLLQLKLLQTC